MFDILFSKLAIIITLLLMLSSISTGATVSANVPLDSWVYPALNKLSGLGLISSALQGTRPYTRLEVARQIKEARTYFRHGRFPAVVKKILERLETEFKTELAEKPKHQVGYIKPLRNFQFEYHYQEGRSSVIAGAALIDASQFALNTNNYGIEYKQGHNGQLTFETEARIGSFLLLNYRPLMLFRENDTPSLQTIAGTAALGLGSVELSAGRQSLWWGRGQHGSLILTNNAKPLNMVRATNSIPMLLPWIFRHLGPFRFDLFISRLEKNRSVPEPYFGGLRFNFKPLPWLEIGSSRTAILSGQERPGINFSEFATILTDIELSSVEDRGNQITVLDAYLRLPFLWGAELYGEVGVEDEDSGFGDTNAWLAGLYLPQIEPTGRASLRFEHADLSDTDRVNPSWYQHDIYLSGYTYEGKILGHHAGGAAIDFFCELEIHLPRSVTLTAFIDYEKRGFNQPVFEEHLQPGLNLSWSLRKNFHIDFIYQFDQISNFDYIENNDQSFHLIQCGISFTW